MFFDWMVVCGTKNGSSVASLWQTFSAILFFKSVQAKMFKFFYALVNFEILSYLAFHNIA